MISDNDIRAVLTAFPVGAVKSVTPLKTGLIHATYRVESDTGTYILQRMSPIFEPSVLEDMREVSEHIAAHDLTTFKLVPTKTGSLSYEENGRHTRLLTYISGRTIETVASLEELHNAGALVARFHTALADYTKPIRHRIPGFHDTPRYMKQLAALDASETVSEKYVALHPITMEVLHGYAVLPESTRSFPLRVLHGDLKLENVLFAQQGSEAVALIDLDTVGRYPLLIEVGDMAWSWTKVMEGDKPTFSPERWRAAFTGYRKAARSLTSDEWHAFPEGCLLTAFELSARFIIDAYEERYFAHDPSRYPTLYEQNLSMARDLAAFITDFQAKRPEIEPLHEVF